MKTKEPQTWTQLEYLVHKNYRDNLTRIDLELLDEQIALLARTIEEKRGKRSQHKTVEILEGLVQFLDTLYDVLEVDGTAVVGRHK